MKKLFSILAVLLVATALFAQVGLTVKAGGTFGFASYKSVAEGKDNNGETEKFEDSMVDKALVLKTNGFGFDVGVQYDITDKLLAYVDFNMLFPGDAKVNFPDSFLISDLKYYGAPDDVIKKYVVDVDAEDLLFKVYSIKGSIADLNEYIEGFKDHVTVLAKNAFFSVSAGAAYKFDFNPVKLAVGGGLTLNKASAKFVMTPEEGAAEYYGKIDASYTFTTFGLNAMVDAKYMVAENVGVGVTLIPQVGLYNKSVLEVSATYVETVEGTVTAKGFALSFAMPIVVGVSYTF